MTTDPTIVIIGASLAGAKAAEGARTEGFDGRIVMVGAEHEYPYERPPLSKAVLRGEVAAASTLVHEHGFYAANGIELLIGRTVEVLDPDTRTVRLDGGEVVPFTAAVVATGAAPRRLDVPGGGLAGVHYLRDLDDARRLGDAIRGARRVAVVGAGWIGSEVAASARQMGADVVLIDPAPTPLHRVLGDDIGEAFRRLHADHGIELRLCTGVAALRGRGTVDHVALTNGDIEAADVVVVGVGVLPRVELAAKGGMHVDNGVVVDKYLRTSAPGVYAAGDVASAWHPHYQRYVRVEHWSNALHQGLTAGINAAGGARAHTRLPYFFSDQYDVGMEYVGLSEPGDTLTVRGSLADRECIAFWHRDGVVTAAMTLNVWDVVENLRSVIVGRRTHEPARLADAGVPLTELA